MFSVSCFGFRALALAQSGLVNINTASLGELDTLPGVGPAVAQSIVNNRPYATVEEISRADGIGEPGSSSYQNIINLITVGGTSEETATTTEETTATSTSSGSSSSSVHYGSSSLSPRPSQTNIALSAGRDRLGSVGSPMEFKLETDVSYLTNAIFKWNFGDGSQGAGEVVTHTYEYPGEYVVVLNASLPSGQVVSRLTAKIIAPELTIVNSNPERIELKNNSKNEVNLFGRVLSAGGKAFVFPQDTIIRPGQSISFSSKVTGLTPNHAFETSLVVVGESRQESQIFAQVERQVEKQKQEKITQLQNQIGSLQQQLASLPKAAPVASAPSLPINPITPVVSVEPAPQPALVLESVEAIEEKREEERGWLEVLKRFFLRTRE